MEYPVKGRHCDSRMKGGIRALTSLGMAPLTVPLTTGQQEDAASMVSTIVFVRRALAEADLECDQEAGGSVCSCGDRGRSPFSPRTAVLCSQKVARALGPLPGKFDEEPHVGWLFGRGSTRGDATTLPLWTLGRWIVDRLPKAWTPGQAPIGVFNVWGGGVPTRLHGPSQDDIPPDACCCFGCLAATCITLGQTCCCCCWCRACTGEHRTALPWQWSTCYQQWVSSRKNRLNGTWMVLQIPWNPPEFYLRQASRRVRCMRIIRITELPTGGPNRDDGQPEWEVECLAALHHERRECRAVPGCVDNALINALLPGSMLNGQPVCIEPRITLEYEARISGEEFT